MNLPQLPTHNFTCSICRNAVSPLNLNQVMRQTIKSLCLKSPPSISSVDSSQVQFGSNQISQIGSGYILSEAGPFTSYDILIATSDVCPYTGMKRRSECIQIPDLRSGFEASWYKAIGFLVQKGWSSSLNYHREPLSHTDEGWIWHEVDDRIETELMNQTDLTTKLKRHSKRGKQAMYRNEFLEPQNAQSDFSVVPHVWACMN